MGEAEGRSGPFLRALAIRRYETVLAGSAHEAKQIVEYRQVDKTETVGWSRPELHGTCGSVLEWRFRRRPDQWEVRKSGSQEVRKCGSSCLACHRMCVWMDGLPVCPVCLYGIQAFCNNGADLDQDSGEDERIGRGSLLLTWRDL